MKRNRSSSDEENEVNEEFHNEGFDDEGFDDEGFDNEGFDNEGLDDEGFDDEEPHDMEFEGSDEDVAEGSDEDSYLEDDDYAANHKNANAGSEYLFSTYRETEGYHETHILPPPYGYVDPAVPGLDLVHGVLFSIESRLHKNMHERLKQEDYYPKSRFRCSVKGFIKTLANEAIWDTTAIQKAILKEGIPFVVDGEGDEHPKQTGPKYRGIQLDTHSMERITKYKDYFDELEKKGPMVAIVQPADEEEFGTWSAEAAKKMVYSGHNSDDKEAATFPITLIGHGKCDEGTRYFIGINHYHGEIWGDNGVYRLRPRCITELIIPGPDPQHCEAYPHFAGI